ncbi:MAG TPA: non-ribosomal peptide synthetase, partial [Anaerolineae bacterium]|nr:non-ribosomal peptide synthetase [Anaerolineae bacterium]
PQLRPVAIGVTGQLYTSGAGLARGYLNRPDLTAKHFIDNPFSNDGSKLYATGDLARFRPNGEIEFLGRQDNQVKLRGFRIEMGEIEHALGQHSAIGAHLVIVHKDANNNKALVAYLVAQAEPAPTHNELATYLQQWLPSYMIPRHFVWLEAFPLTPNGKVDRRALPTPDLTRADLVGEFVAPRTRLEQQLVDIWCAVLTLDTIGVHDDFFALGGHSLLATQVASRIRTELVVDLPLRQLFERPTVAELATFLQSEGDNLLYAAPPLLPATRDDHLPLSFTQERLWFLAQLQPDSAAYNIPMTIDVRGSLDPTLLAQALQWLVQRHESLRTTFVAHNGIPQQIVADEVEIFLQLLPCTEDEIEATVIAEAQHHFDLATGPLLRTTLLQITDQRQILLLNMHHIISDGWSVNIAAQELSHAYLALAQGELPALPPLPLQFADYAIWQRAWLQGEVLDKQLTYWQNQLDQTTGILNLPTDFPRPTLQTFNGSFYYTSLPNQLFTQLNAFSQAHNATAFMTLLAAFNMLLWRYSGQTDIVVGTPIANRHQRETEALIGMFVNTLPLRTQLVETQTFSDLLAQLREATLDAYAHQDVPLAILVDTLP